MTTDHEKSRPAFEAAHKDFHLIRNRHMGLESFPDFYYISALQHMWQAWCRALDWAAEQAEAIQSLDGKTEAFIIYDEKGKPCIATRTKPQDSAPAAPQPVWRTDQPRPETEQAGACGWRPIETAPRDEMDDVLLCLNRAVLVGYFADGVWRDTNEGFPLLNQPTHWQPLPPPPDGRRVEVKASEKEEGE
jgi:hypothetical protein